MKHLTILVDLDDTIEDLLGAWVSYLNAKHGTTIQKDSVTHWDISKSFPTLTKEQIYEPLYLNDFWLSVKPIDGAANALQKLIADGHRVLIVTASNYHTLPTKMEQVLFKHFPFFSWDDVIITSHKQLINGDIFIDDGVHNLRGSKCFRLLMDAPHNRAYDAKNNGMIRVCNWDEAYAIITKYAQSSESIGKEVDILE